MHLCEEHPEGTARVCLHSQRHATLHGPSFVQYPDKERNKGYYTAYGCVWHEEEQKDWTWQDDKLCYQW